MKGILKHTHTHAHTYYYNVKTTKERINHWYFTNTEWLYFTLKNACKVELNGIIKIYTFLYVSLWFS